MLNAELPVMGDRRLHIPCFHNRYTRFVGDTEQYSTGKYKISRSKLCGNSGNGSYLESFRGGRMGWCVLTGINRVDHLGYMGWRLSVNSTDGVVMKVETQVQPACREVNDYLHYLHGIPGSIE